MNKKLDLSTIEKYFGNRSNSFRFFGILGVIAAVIAFAHWFKLHLPGIESSIAELGPLAPFAFILLFVAATPFFLSVDALCLASGFLFSLTAGCVYVALSTYLAAAVIFFVGRHLLREKVEMLLKQHPKLQHIDKVLDNDELKIMFILRLLPLPFAWLSYAFSVTQVKFKPYIISTSGILVYNLTLVYLGFTAKHLAAIKNTSPVNYPLIIVGVVLVLIVFAMIVRLARQKIAKIAPEFND